MMMIGVELAVDTILNFLCFGSSRSSFTVCILAEVSPSESIYSYARTHAWLVWELERSSCQLLEMHAKGNVNKLGYKQAKSATD